MADRSLALLWQVARSSARALLVIGALFVVIWWLERRAGKDTGRYARSPFAHDLAYALFYSGGLYTTLFGALVADRLLPHLAPLKVGLLAALPVPLQAVAYWVIADFIAYWVHRTQHQVDALWAFHSVHHAPDSLTFASTYRNHPLEQLAVNTLLLAPFLVIGVPPALWLPIWMLQQFLEAVQHAELDWTYGPFYRVIVSPVYHRIHHAPERVRHDRNYAKIFPVWDVLFGTLSEEAAPPARYGVAGLVPPPTLAAQLAHPFRQLAARDAGGAAAAPPPAAPAVPPGA